MGFTAVMNSGFCTAYIKEYNWFINGINDDYLIVRN